MEPQQHSKKAKNVKVQLERNRGGPILNVQHLELCFKHRFLMVSSGWQHLHQDFARHCSCVVPPMMSTQATPPPNTCAIACWAKTNVGKFNQTVCFLVFKLEAAADVPLQKRQQKSPTFSHREARFHGETAMLATNRCHCTT